MWGVFLGESSGEVYLILGIQLAANDVGKFCFSLFPFEFCKEEKKVYEGIM